MELRIMVDGLLRRLPVTVATRFGWLGSWLAVQDPRLLCERLELEGWEHVVAADDGEGQVEVACEASGPWQAALWTLAFYRGPTAVHLGSGLPPGSVGGLSAAGVRCLDGEQRAADGERMVWVDETPPATADEARLRASASLEADGKIRVRFAPGSTG